MEHLDQRIEVVRVKAVELIVHWTGYGDVITLIAKGIGGNDSVLCRWALH